MDDGFDGGGGGGDGGAAVAVIVPVHNAALFIEAAVRSVYEQSFDGPMELCVYDDASTDGSADLIEAWRARLAARGVRLLLRRAAPGSAARGCGYASNRAVELATAPLLCFLDADDMMMPARIAEQVALSRSCGPDTLVGCDLVRDPPGSTSRYIDWLTQLSQDQLMTQRFVECTVAKPSWFMWRSLFDRAGPFDEGGRGVPEDLMFFYRVIELGGRVAKVPRPLTVYRYHAHAASFAVTEEAIMRVRVGALERQVLNGLEHFSIWGAGRTGKRFFRLLSAPNRAKVSAFGDVKPSLLRAGALHHEGGIPPTRVVPPRDLQPPVVMCVKRGLTDGVLEACIAERALAEGTELIYFT